MREPAAGWLRPLFLDMGAAFISWFSVFIGAFLGDVVETIFVYFTAGGSYEPEQCGLWPLQHCVGAGLCDADCCALSGQKYGGSPYLFGGNHSWRCL